MAYQSFNAFTYSYLVLLNLLIPYLSILIEMLNYTCICTYKVYLKYLELYFTPKAAAIVEFEVLNEYVIGKYLMC